MTENYKQLVSKLGQFRRKYFLFALLKGMLIFFSILFLYLLILFLSEYLFYLNPDIKIVVLVFTLALLLSTFVWLIALPLFKFLSSGSTLNKKEVASLVNKFFPENKDALVNIIELAESKFNDYSSELINASIEQKISQLKVLDFSSGLKFSLLKSNFYRFSGVCILFLGLYFSFVSEFKNVAYRLVYYQVQFVKPAPFEFILKNNNLNVRKGAGIKLVVELKGRQKPEVLYISFGGNNFLMNKDKDLFTYDIENINNSFTFYFTGNKYISKGYQLNVLPVPIITGFTVKTNPPAYTGVISESLENNGNLKVPAGTSVQWNFETSKVDSLIFLINDSIRVKSEKDGDHFIVNRSFSKDCKYSVILKNQYFEEKNTLNYAVQVTPDLFPEIEVAQVVDSVNLLRYYFKGHVSDDYGFHSLEFHLKNDYIDTVLSLPVLNNLVEQEFYYTYDFSVLKDNNAAVNYYFTVKDNDQINNFKETASTAFTLKFPDRLEQLKYENENFQSIENLVSKSFDLNNSIQNDLNKLKKDQINDNLTDWEKQQKIKEISEKRDQLENVLDEISKRKQQLDNYSNSFSDEKKQLLEKQEEVNQLLNEVFSDELKKLFEEFNELAKSFDGKRMDELTDQMDMQLDDLSKQLERNLQMLKRMKVTQKIDDIISRLYKQSEAEKLNKSELDGDKDYVSIKEKEAKAKDNLQLMKQEFSDALKMNGELNKPINMTDFSKDFDQISEQYNKVLDDLSKEKRRQSGEKMEKNASMLENLAFAMKQNLESNKKKQKGEDLNNLKQLLDNVVVLSVDQENVMTRSKSLQQGDPSVNSVKLRQSRITDEVAMVRDSLYSLSQRNAQISGVVNKELLDLQQNLTDIKDSYEDGSFYNILRFQQNCVTALNNLALFLNEVVDQAEKDMENSMSGDGDCEKPGGRGKKSSGMSMLKDSQEAIKKQLQQMMDQMKSGNTQGMSKQLGQTLAQQEVMQNLIREMMGSAEVGSDAKEQLKMVDQLIESNKVDLMNKTVSAQTIQRQNMILNKLLNAERAEIERDVDEKRESKTGEDKFLSNPNLFFEYNKKAIKSNEEFYRSSFKLESYYDSKYRKYINNLKQ